MAIDKNSNKWTSSKELEEKQLFLERTVGPVEVIYQKNTFCSGFMADNIIAEIDGDIYAVTDGFKVFKKKSEPNAQWKEFIV